MPVRSFTRGLGETPVATVLLARLEPADGAWRLRWSSAGHPPPLLLLPDGRVRYLTDGLVESPGRPLDRGLDALAVTASRFAGRSPEELCRAPLDHLPGDGHDDKAVIALRTPPLTGYARS
ncbi:SpoIIE family protein phosphatase [Streptomyces eurythermus]|uniref:SpoIIE family protein phosphatase n=1 Tax=Streptomyces eurythermus TaxID=42237 RepID=UPI0036D41025